MYKDLESLMNVWGLYQGTSFFTQLDSLGIQEFEKLKKDMGKYKTMYEDIQNGKYE